MLCTLLKSLQLITLSTYLRNPVHGSIKRRWCWVKMTIKHGLCNEGIRHSLLNLLSFYQEDHRTSSQIIIHQCSAWNELSICNKYDMYYHLEYLIFKTNLIDSFFLQLMFSAFRSKAFHHTGINGIQGFAQIKPWNLILSSAHSSVRKILHYMPERYRIPLLFSDRIDKLELMSLFWVRVSIVTILLPERIFRCRRLHVGNGI